MRQELKKLRPTKSLTPGEQTAARLERVRSKSEKLTPLIDKAFGKVGITGEPIGAKKVQGLLAAEGVKTGDNIFSRGIIKMREH